MNRPWDLKDRNRWPHVMMPWSQGQTSLRPGSSRTSHTTSVSASIPPQNPNTTHPGNLYGRRQDSTTSSIWANHRYNNYTNSLGHKKLLSFIGHCGGGGAGSICAEVTHTQWRTQASLGTVIRNHSSILPGREIFPGKSRAP